ncbi:MAG: hypothetical protein ACI9SP_004629 [Arenicella sp.]|jgi:hypothetical protein
MKLLNHPTPPVTGTRGNGKLDADNRAIGGRVTELLAGEVH